MRVGYMRCSTESQNLDRQEKIMKELGVEKLYSEKVSGQSTENRPELKKMLSFLRDGDTLIVESISRLCRSTRDLLAIIEELKKNGVAFISQKESIDSKTPAGIFMLTVFGALATLERESLLQRQGEGIAAAQKRGIRFGRKPIEINKDFEKLIEDWKARKIKTADAIKRSGYPRSTFYYLASYREKEVKVS